MTELSEVEHIVLKAFRVTGFFSKTPKRNVSRVSSVIYRIANANDDDLSVDEVALGISGLTQKGLLSFDEDTASLTDAGYEALLELQ